jgi:hypothetical protein
VAFLDNIGFGEDELANDVRAKAGLPQAQKLPTAPGAAAPKPALKAVQGQTSQGGGAKPPAAAPKKDSGAAQPKAAAAGGGKKASTDGGAKGSPASQRKASAPAKAPAKLQTQDSSTGFSKVFKKIQE